MPKEQSGYDMGLVSTSISMRTALEPSKIDLKRRIVGDQPTCNARLELKFDADTDLDSKTVELDAWLNANGWKVQGTIKQLSDALLLDITPASLLHYAGVLAIGYVYQGYSLDTLMKLKPDEMGEFNGFRVTQINHNVNRTRLEVASEIAKELRLYYLRTESPYNIVAKTGEYGFGRIICELRRQS